jgi:hypothetical protein
MIAMTEISAVKARRDHTSVLATAIVLTVREWGRDVFSDPEAAAAYPLLDRIQTLLREEQAAGESRIANERQPAD